MGARLEQNSNAIGKRIESHSFENEEGEEYGASNFGGFSDYFRRKKIKLQNLDAELRSQSDDKPPIFRGIVAHVNGYTQPSLNDLHRLIVTHGGGFMQYLDGKTAVTHIIASNLTPKKAVEFRKYRIVKPAWVVDSITAGKLLPWNSYRVLDQGPGQKVLGFDDGMVVGQATAQRRGYRDQTDTSWYTSQLKAETPQVEEPDAPPLPRQQSHAPDEDDDLYDAPPPAQLATPPKTSSPTRGTGETASRREGQRTETAELGFGHQEAEDQDDQPHGTKRRLDELSDSAPKKSKLTAEEHNALLLADPRIRKSTVVNPDFLEQYYRESRLHHLSTWKADLRSQLLALTAEKSVGQKNSTKRPSGSRRYILHVDFDSFFAAVSLKKFPQYKDKPAVVAHGGGNGSEIASCNYPARKFGIKNGMWMRRAQELCSDLKILPYDFPAYEEASRAFYDSILSIGGIVQPVSVDEALVEVSSICISAGGSDGKETSEESIYREQSRAGEIAQTLRDEVRKKTGCEVSVGIGGNILLAKVALRKAKPAGQHQIKPEEALDCIGQLRVQDLPGVAHNIGRKLEELGIQHVRNIRETSRERLTMALGPKTGEKIWDYSRAIDGTEVGEQVVRKSVSAEVSWGVRFENQEQVNEFIGSLCEELHKRLMKERVKGRHFTMKVMKRAADAPLDPPKHLGHGRCDVFNKSAVLGVATNAPDVLTREALSILKGFGFSPGELRGIGVQMTRLEPLKMSAGGQLESSQRRLQFKVSEPPKDKPQPEDPIQEVRTPEKIKAVDAVASAARDPGDPIQDVETPRRLKSGPLRLDGYDIATPRKQREQIAFGAEELNSVSPSRRPLNTLGTQFVLPTQFDPMVLAKLPEDIRAKLTTRIRATKPSSPASSQGEAGGAPRATPFALALPSQSQLDPEILAQLPADLRSEILAQYQRSPRRPKGQTVLPQSPHGVRTIKLEVKKGPPPPRKRGRPPKVLDSNSTLKQSNFLVAPRQQMRAHSHDGSTPGTTDTEGDEDGEISQEFLDALPEDLRREVLEEHRRVRLKKRPGLDFQSANKKTATRPADAQPGPAERFLRLPPRPLRPTFTTKRLSKPEDLREAVRAWWEEFREEGPYVEDVDVLVAYLEKVVSAEMDMAKAVGVVRWMAWVIENAVEDGGEESGGAGAGKWLSALDRVKEGVQRAIQTRGLGRVAF